MATTFVLIDKAIIGAGGVSSITFSSIPNTYTDLKLLVSARDNRSGADSDDFKLTINNNTSATYSNKRLYGTGSSTGSDGGSSTGNANSYSGVLTGSTATSNTFGNTEFYFANYTSSNSKSWCTDGVSENNATSAFAALYANLINDTNPISEIKIEGYNGNTLQQYTTAYLYGIKNS